MPLSAAPAVAATAAWQRPALRLALAAGALLLAGLVVAGLSALVAPGLATPPPRSPFGVGFREAAPGTQGIGRWLLEVQSNFARSLQDGVIALRDGRAGPWPLILTALAYGVFHAAGPGHGKAVIAGYIIADERALRRGFALSFAAALVQALVALALVSIAAILFRATAATMNAAGDLVERASFALVAAVGTTVTWRKSAALADLLRGRTGTGAACGHIHLTDAAALSRLATWRDRAGVVLAAGTRPCAGAVLILVFALTQGVFLTGVAAVFAMALGTALTTGALASLAVFAKAVALRLAGGRAGRGSVVLASAELVAAAFVLTLGVAMLVGLTLAKGS